MKKSLPVVFLALILFVTSNQLWLQHGQSTDRMADALEERRRRLHQQVQQQEEAVILIFLLIQHQNHGSQMSLTRTQSESHSKSWVNAKDKPLLTKSNSHSTADRAGLKPTLIQKPIHGLSQSPHQ